MGEIKEITKEIKEFSRHRGWLGYHNHKDMAISLSVEAAEVLEHFQWKSPDEVDRHAKEHRDEIGEELADVAMYLFALADNMGVDLADAIRRKMEKNAERFPVE